MYNFGIMSARTGYRVAYHPESDNRCPGCGNQQWLIGRSTAECAFCHTALPINGGAVSGGMGCIRRDAQKVAA